MRTYILTLCTALCLLLPAASVSAQEAAHNDIIITVNGMVCDFCAQSVLKVFEEYDAATGIDINMDAATVIVHLKPGQELTDEEINKAITYAGYDLVSTQRITHEG